MLLQRRGEAAPVRPAHLEVAADGDGRAAAAVLLGLAVQAHWVCTWLASQGAFRSGAAPVGADSRGASVKGRLPHPCLSARCLFFSHRHGCGCMATCPSRAGRCPPCALLRSSPQPSRRCRSSMGSPSLVSWMRRPKCEFLYELLSCSCRRKLDFLAHLFPSPFSGDRPLADHKFPFPERWR